MSEQANKIEELKQILIKFISSEKEQFKRNGKNYLETFNSIFADNQLLKEMISQYIEFIKSLPDTTLFQLTPEKTSQLGSKIIRSMIPQLEECSKKDTDFVIEKSLMVFAGQDALDYINNSSPTLKARFNMICSASFNPKNPDNKLKILLPGESFDFQKVATVLNQPKNVADVLESLKIFSQQGLNENVIEMSANIFSGIIAKLVGKNSKFKGELPKELIIAAQKKAVELAILCFNNSVLTVQDKKQAINLGKVFGKATRDQLYTEYQKLSQLIPATLQEHYFNIFTDNAQKSLDLLNKSTALNTATLGVLSQANLTSGKQLRFTKKEELRKLLNTNHDARRNK